MLFEQGLSTRTLLKMKLWIDTETYSNTPITHGGYRYVADSELLIVAWATDDGDVHVEDITAGAPSDELSLALLEADEVWAHNAMFDRRVVGLHLADVPLQRWRCSMVQALAHSLPGSLDQLCSILAVPQDDAKLKDGKALVRLFTTPRPKNMKLRRADRTTHPAEWARFMEYAGNDIKAMRQCAKRMPSWNGNATELALWHLDQVINDRGFAVDLELVDAAVRTTAAEVDRLAAAAQEFTNGQVGSTTQRDALLEHILQEYRVALPDLRGSTVERLLADDSTPDELRQLLQLRQQASATSTSKYQALAKGATGGRMRGTLQFCGAGRTGRWAGRTFQPQNLPRPVLEPDEVEDGIAAMKAGVADLLVHNVMELASSALRGCIIAPPGKKLVVADLSNIEGRMLAWLAGEQWKLQAFRDFDAGVGPDLYKLAYAKAFGIAPEQVTKHMRQIGKVMELAFGYEGGVGAWVTFANAYGIDLEALGAQAWSTIPGDVRHEAGEFYDWLTRQKDSNDYGLSRTAYVVCDSFKRMWRMAHLGTVSLWRELQQAAIDAVATPSTTIEVRSLKVRRDGGWLRIGLPSGRALCYPQPKLIEGALTYMGINQFSRKWSRLNTYGGKLVENVTQAAARDVLAHSMPSIENAGYPIVLTVHDEILTETPDTADFTVDALAGLMSVPPGWAGDLPLAAAGFEAYRYRKD